MLSKTMRCVLVIALVANAGAQLNPNRKPHSHTNYVKDCMKPYLEKYSTDCNEDGIIRKNTCYNDRVHDLNVRPSSKASIVEIAPEDDPNFKHVSLNEDDRMLLFYLATCTAYVGRADPWGEKTENGQDLELELPLTEELVQNVWDTPFQTDNDTAFPYSHAEERYFNVQESFYGGNRVVYLQEFMQILIPDLYWKLRETAAKAVQAGKDAGLFGDRANQLPVNAIGVREIEYVEYRYQDGLVNHLNWHRDTDSVYTMVHMLDQPGTDFEGGIFSIKTKEGEEAVRSDEENAFMQPESRGIPFNMTQGSGVLFDAETHHRASPVTNGQRKVLVIEFWEHGEVDGWEWRPGQELAHLYPNPAAPVISDNCELDNGIYQRSCWEQL